MLKSLLRFFKRKPIEQPTTSDSLLDLEKEVQRLRLDLAESQHKVEQFKDELERSHNRAKQDRATATAAQFERLFSDLAAPAAQLHTQIYMVDNEGKILQARDVLVVAKSLLRSLQNQGLVFAGQVGECVAFDPNLHEPLSLQDQPQPGQQSILRFVGVSYQGRLLKKAGVTLVPGEEQG